MWIRSLRYFGVIAAFVAFGYILSTADYSVLSGLTKYPQFLFTVILAVSSTAFSSVSFAYLASREFSSAGKFRFFFEQSISASLSNFGLPLSGTTSKVSALKSAGVLVSETLALLVSVSLTRAAASIILMLLTLPIDLLLKAALVFASVATYLGWSKGLFSSKYSERFKILQPSQLIRKTHQALRMVLLELGSISTRGILLFSIWTSLSGDATISVSVFAAASATLVSIIPLSPGGIGTQDSAIFLAFSLAGLMNDVSAALVVATRILGFISLGMLNLLFRLLKGFR